MKSKLIISTLFIVASGIAQANIPEDNSKSFGGVLQANLQTQIVNGMRESRFAAPNAVSLNPDEAMVQFESPKGKSNQMVAKFGDSKVAYAVDKALLDSLVSQNDVVLTEKNQVITQATADRIKSGVINLKGIEQASVIAINSQGMIALR